MKAGGRFRFFGTLILILASAAAVGGLIYKTTYDTLDKASRQMLERSVDQGVFLVENYLHNQYSLLSLYAQVPGVQEGRFSSLPDWLRTPRLTPYAPKELSIVDRQGMALTSAGKSFDVGDREYFRQSLATGSPSVSFVLSRVDNTPTVILTQPIPGDHPKAAILVAAIDLMAFRSMLQSIQGLSGAEILLTDAQSRVLVTASGSVPTSTDGTLLESSKAMKTAPWTLRARIQVADLLAPVRMVLLMVGVLIILGAGLIVGFAMVGMRHRKDLDQMREDRTQALREAYSQIRKLAYHDPVTQLPNRNLAMRRIADALQAQEPMKVIVVALARFRNLTTTFGMNFGDTLLKETAARLKTFVGPGSRDFLGRLGGSEFLLLLDVNRCGDDDLQEILQIFQQPMGKEGLTLHVSIHAGACQLLKAGTTPEEVIKSAETALWAARERGPNEVSELTSEALASRLRKAQLQKLLPGALERGELSVHYQPQVKMRDGTIAGYEALLRWTSPELGPVSPVEFIPIAEESGFIVPLGYWVLDQGITFARELEAQGNPAVVSVNVSAVQFLHLGFLDEVERKIAESGLPFHDIGLEITESTLLEGIDQIRPALMRLMDAGVKVSLDDFGTGYSSLNYLKDLPLHVLKIDKSFIDALDTGEQSVHLIECIITLAHHLGLIVVAEGIETDRQSRLLAGAHCDQVQGFFTGRPRPAGAYLTAEFQR